MTDVTGLAAIAALMGDPARAAMLGALMDGRALTAKELAEAAGITPQTASGHLAQLTASGLLAVARQGRHRYHLLASAAVAQTIEGIMVLAAACVAPGAAAAPRRVAVGPRDEALRRARTCYDHLAGAVAVSIADRMVERGFVELEGDGGAVTEAGSAFLFRLGVDVGGCRTRGAKVFCRPCLDWSERRPHLAGAVGAALCQLCLSRGWVRRRDGTRALTITPAGQLALRREFGVVG